MTELQPVLDVPSFGVYLAIEDEGSIHKDGSPPRVARAPLFSLPRGGAGGPFSERIPTTSDVGLPGELRSASPKSLTLAQKKLLQACLICALFMVIETVAGVWANSLALLTDASHLLSDFSSFLISLFAIWVSSLPGTRKLSFGYHRAEILGALISVVVIWIVTVFLIIEAYHRFSSPKPVNGRIMFITAFFGTSANLVMTYILGVHSHGLGPCSGHHHHSHQDASSLDNSKLQNHCCSGHSEKNRVSTMCDSNHQHQHKPSLISFQSSCENNASSPLRDQRTALTCHQDSNRSVTSTHKAEKPERSSCNASPDAELLDSAASGRSCTTQFGTDRPTGTDDEDQHMDSTLQLSVAPACSPQCTRSLPQVHHHDTTLSQRLLDGLHEPPVIQDDRHNVNLRAARIHAAGDLIQNIGVLLAAGLIWFRPSWSIADPLCTFLFSLLVLATTYSILVEAMNVLMEGTPKEVDLLNLRRDLQGIPSVTEVHDLHVWSLSVGKPSLACHLVVDAEEEARRVLRRATHVCQSKHGILHTTIQIDYSSNKLACDTDAHSKCH